MDIQEGMRKENTHLQGRKRTRNRRFRGKGKDKEFEDK